MNRHDSEFDPDADDDIEDAGAGGGDDDDFVDEDIARYIVDEIARAFGAHERAARGTVQRVLPLGEMLALFNLADQFGLIDRVRADLDARFDGNAYLAFSEAMKDALLDRGFGPGGGAAVGAGWPAPRTAARWRPAARAPRRPRSRQPLRTRPPRSHPAAARRRTDADRRGRRAAADARSSAGSRGVGRRDTPAPVTN